MNHMYVSYRGYKRASSGTKARGMCPRSKRHHLTEQPLPSFVCFSPHFLPRGENSMNTRPPFCWNHGTLMKPSRIGCPSHRSSIWWQDALTIRSRTPFPTLWLKPVSSLALRPVPGPITICFTGWLSDKRWVFDPLPHTRSMGRYIGSGGPGKLAQTLTAGVWTRCYQVTPHVWSYLNLRANCRKSGCSPKRWAFGLNRRSPSPPLHGKPRTGASQVFNTFAPNRLL